MTNRRPLYTAILCLLALATVASAQTTDNTQQQRVGVFKNLDLSLTAGSTGVGIEVASQMGKTLRLRAGFDIMPRFEQDVRFGIASFDTEGNVVSTKFDQLSEKLKVFTGYDINDHVDMTCKPKMQNFKLLVDVFPFKGKGWQNLYFTAGFYWGPKTVGTAINTVEGAQTLVGMMMYNHLYDKALNVEPIYSTVVYDEWGDAWPVDVYLPEPLPEKLVSTGRLAVNLGRFKNQYLTDADGNYLLDANGNMIKKPYQMVPDKNGTVSAHMKTNTFKPYLGFGYGGRLMRRSDRYHVSFDCGMLFWGGKPKVITHDGVDLVNDVEGIGGKVGDYVDAVSKLGVYPVLNLRLTCKLF